MFTISYLLNDYMYISCALQFFAKEAEKKNEKTKAFPFALVLLHVSDETFAKMHVLK